MTTNDFDYRKPRIQVENLLPEYFRDDIKVSMMNSGINRLLTPDDTIYVNGTIGKKNPSVKSDNRIIEESVDRQAWQLQPLLYSKIATAEHIYSYDDILNKLSHIGIDVNRLQTWGSTEFFNFAPPIDIDKLINYGDYYWVGDVSPQYITIKNKDTVIKSQIFELTKYLNTQTVAGASTSVLASIQTQINTLYAQLSSNAAGWSVAEWDDNGGNWDNNNLWETYHVTPPTGDNSWDAVSDGVINDWALQNKWVHKTEVVDLSIAIRATMPIIEYNPNLELNNWLYTKHNWLYRVDATSQWKSVDVEPTLLELYGELPIISIDYDSQSVNPQGKQVFVVKGYAIDSLPIGMQFSVEATNCNDGIWTVSSTEFIASLGATYVYTTNTITFTSIATEYFDDDGNVNLTSNTPDAYFGEYGFDLPPSPYMMPTTCPVDLTGHVYPDVQGRITPVVTSLGDSWQGLYTQWLWESVNDPVPVTDQTINPTQSVYTTVLSNATTDIQLPFTFFTNIDELYVYVDGRRQYGTYFENQTLNEITGSSISFTSPIPAGSNVTVKTGPACILDIGREMVWVRTIQANTPLITNAVDYICLLRYRLHEQTKTTHTQYPMFNLYTVSGEPAYRATPIFKFTESSTAPINTNVNLRIVTTINPNITGVNYSFDQLLNDPNTGELFCYRDPSLLDLPNFDDLQSIWQCGYNNDYTYVPRYVNEFQLADGDSYVANTGVTQTAQVPLGSTAGAWEIPNQWYYNPMHALNTTITFTQLYTHYNTIIKNQNPPTGFDFVAPGSICKLLPHINYGVGGTIREHNGSYDNFLSSMVNDIFTPSSILSFAANQYDNCISTITDLYLRSVENILNIINAGVLTNTSNYIIDQIINTYAQNVSLNTIYGDSTAYNSSTAIGMPNWIATLPIFGLVTPQQPLFLQDSTLGINQLVHHDGHISDVTLNTNDRINIINAIITNNGSQSTGSFPDINTLPLGYFWYNITTDVLWRFNVVYIGPNTPSSGNTLGTYWYNNVDHNLYVRSSASIQGWVVEPDHTKAWEVIDLSAYYANLLLAVEQRLYDISITYPLNKLSMSDIITNTADSVTFYDNLNTQYLNYVSSKNLDPNNNDYLLSNPYTWNYRDIPLTTQFFDTSVLSVITPNTQTIKWGARWYSIYQILFNTMYPHLEPWKLQGYLNEPTWWASQYVDTSGTRRWKAQMWTNIAAGITPVGIPTPTTPPKTYTFFCVNILDTNNGYALDVLLPPYVTGPTAFKQQTLLWGIPTTNLIQYITRGYTFGDQGPTEQVWRSSTAYQYDILIAAFLLQPIKVFQHIFGYEYYNINRLQVEKTTKQVISHADVYFHGDVVNNKLISINGLNQWYINAIRYSDYDATSSDFSTLWTGWVPQLAYQFNSAINTNSLNVNTSFYNITPFDYGIHLKKAPAVDEYWVTSMIVTLQTPGTTSPVSKLLPVPLDAGEDWTYRIDVPINVGVPLSFYDVNHYTVTSVNDLTNEITLNKNIPWATGTQIQLATNLFGIKSNIPYFVIKTGANVIKLADSYIYGYELYNDINVYDTLHWYTSTVDTTPDSGDLWNNNGVLYQYNINTNSWVAKSQTTPMFILPNSYNGSNLKIYNHGVLLTLGTDYIVSDYWVELLINITTADLYVRTLLATTSEVYELQDSFQALNGAHTIQTWNHYTINPNVTNQLAAPISITGIQNVINFIDGVVAYAEAQGWQFTDLSRELDRDDQVPTMIISWQTEIEKLIDKMYIGFNNTYNHVNNSIETVYDKFELNPFKYNIWLQPKRGIISDVITGPFNDIRTQPIVYDQLGVPIISVDNLKIYRLDQTTHFMYPHESVLTSHMGGLHLFADTYENIILFNNYTVDGNLIYDPFIGMNVAKINLEFKKHFETTGRPSLSGHFLVDQELVENMELGAEHLRNMYSTYTADEYAEHIEYARSLLNYNAAELSYLDNVNLGAKSKFIFWRGMIQHKGSNEAVSAFTNSRLFNTISLDEYWAYKVAEFGDNRVKFKPQLLIQDTDVDRGVIRYQFTSSIDPIQTQFTEITNTDITRWIRLPEVSELQKNNLYFDATANVINNPNVYTVLGIKYTDLPTSCDLVQITFDYIPDFSHIGRDGGVISDGTYTGDTNYTVPTNEVQLSDGIYINDTTYVLDPNAIVYSGGMYTGSSKGATNYDDFIQLTRSYIMGTNSLLVYFNGALVPAAGNYVEVTPNTIRIIAQVDVSVEILVILHQGVLIPDIHYTMLNAHTIQWLIDPATLNDVTVYYFNPSIEHSSGAKLLDIKSNIAISDLKIWDPARGIHDSVIDAAVNYISSTDPAAYQFDLQNQILPDLTYWSAREVGKLWIDTSTAVYVPYYDHKIFNDLSQRAFYWGKLAEWGTVNTYEWVSSPVPPSMYANYVASQDTTVISQNEKATGTPLSYTLISTRPTVNDDWTDWVKIEDLHMVIQCNSFISQQGPLTINVNTGDANYQINNQLTISSISDTFDVFVNELKLTASVDYTFTIDDTTKNIITIVINNVQVRDTVRIIKYGYIPSTAIMNQINSDSSSLIQYLVYYPYTYTTAVSEISNTINFTYYFWVQGATNRSHFNNMSAVDIQSLYLKPQGIYAIYQNPLPAYGSIPPRYTQFMVFNASQIVTEGKRYAIMFVKDFILRDQINNNEGMLKNKHQEWTLLRANQIQLLSRTLWDKITETLIGSKINDSSYIIPALNRVLYDSINNATTQYGIGYDQCMGDKQIILASLLARITDTSFDTTPINKETFLEEYPFDSTANIIIAMDYIYNNFKSVNVNTLFIGILQDTLSFTPQLEGIFKTSMVSLLSVSPLITAADVIDV